MKLPLLVAAASIAAFAACPDLTSQAIAHTTIQTAEMVTGGEVTPPGMSSAIKALPKFCRVTGTIKPSSDSDIKFEVWLPEESEWNGRYLGAGNGGFAGSINYGGITSAVQRGYATASTDTGHATVGALNIDGSWANGHLEKLIDYGHRAIHETTVAAKALIKAYYTKPLAHSYFSSCSNGGRQALVEVQRYPGDFDGVIAGAPASHFTHIAAEFLTIAQALTANYIPQAKLKAIDAAVVAACDASDGVKDGVLNDPRKCKFDPKSMVCEGAESDSCLNAGQADTLAKIYAGTRDMPGYEPGGELGFAGWGLWIMGASLTKSAQFMFGSQMYAHMVYGNKDWDYKTFNFARDTKSADEKIGSILNAVDPNLKTFTKHGGKLILYHGWCDAALPPRNTIGYYEAVRAKMGAKQADAFLRLYMLPGVQHCGGGPGPNHMGEFDKEPDAASNMLLALERWVESGVAPLGLTAVRYKGDRRTAGVERTRPICMYPQVAVYKGAGSTDEAGSFECKVP